MIYLKDNGYAVTLAGTVATDEMINDGYEEYVGDVPQLTEEFQHLEMVDNVLVVVDDGDANERRLDLLEIAFDKTLAENTVEVRAAIVDGEGNITTPAVVLKARIADSGIIQKTIDLMTATGATTEQWWNRPNWYTLTKPELQKLLDDGVASIKQHFADFEIATNEIS